MNVLAIDQGTSATKALVVAPDGVVLGMAEVAVHPRVVAGDGVEQDPEELWHSLMSAGRAALDDAGVSVGAAGLARHVPHGYFLFRVDRFLDATEVEVRQDERVLWRQRYRHLVPACSIHLDAGWLTKVASDGGPIAVRVRPDRQS